MNESSSQVPAWRRDRQPNPERIGPGGIRCLTSATWRVLQPKAQALTKKQPKAQALAKKRPKAQALAKKRPKAQALAKKRPKAQAPAKKRWRVLPPKAQVLAKMSEEKSNACATR